MTDICPWLPQTADPDTIPSEQKIFVGGMPFGKSEAEIMQHFAKFSPVAVRWQSGKRGEEGEERKRVGPYFFWLAR